MTNKTIGTLALIGAPMLFVGMYIESVFTFLSDSWFAGVWGLLYITALTGIVAALKRSGVLGCSVLGKAMPFILFVTLILSNISNLITLFAAKNQPSFFFYIDLFWPISHLLMIVVGILAISAGKLRGWKRYVPLAMGLWLPFAMGMIGVLGRTSAGFFAGGLYNAIVVVLLALVVRSLPEKNTIEPATASRFEPVLR